jgi:hypothetical protein
MTVPGPATAKLLLDMAEEAETRLIYPFWRRSHCFPKRH